MINQILDLAHARHFQKFTVILSSGDRYQVPTRDHVSIPPTENDQQPSYITGHVQAAASIFGPGLRKESSCLVSLPGAHVSWR